MSATLSLDFADPERSTAALLRGADGEGGTWLVLEGGVATAGEARGHELSIADDGERAAASLTLDSGELELEARRSVGVSLGQGSAFADATGAAIEAFAARGHAEWRLGDRHRVDAPGRIVRMSGEPDWTRVDLVRSLVAVLDDGSLLVAVAARPIGAEGHGDEVVDAVIVNPEGTATRFEESLLSTEYGPDGHHRRAGVELWPPGDAAPVRCAGTLIGGNREVAFLRFTADGSAGTATYELLRPT